jgi:hypothetical protein
MYVRLKSGQTQAVGVGSENVYPGVAKAPGRWVRVDDTVANRKVIEKLNDILEVFEGDLPPAEVKKLTKAQRGERRFEYKGVIETEHWSKIVARIKTDNDETSLQDWLLAAKEAGKDDDSGIAKAVRQRLEELKSNR